MKYRELQQALRPYKEQGLTTIMLTSTKGQLQAELERLESSVSMSQIEEEKTVTSEDIPPFEPFDPLEVALQMMDEQVAETEVEAPQPTDTKEVEQVAKILPLAIESRWFDMIASGEKKEEYREIKPHYQSRFKKEWTHIKFTNGYGSDRPSFTIELLSVSIGLPKPEWSEGAFDQGNEVFILDLGKIVDANFEFPSDTEEEQPYIPPNYQSTDDVELTADDVAAEIETFLGDVAEKKLSEEQLEAIAIALNDANDRSVTASEALAQAGQFRLFTPNQLLAWGFDHIIPRPGMLARFQKASTAQIGVSVDFLHTPHNDALVAAWAASFKCTNWDAILVEGYQPSPWYFSSTEAAEQFQEYCSKLDFVQSATIDRVEAEKAMVGVG